METINVEEIMKSKKSNILSLILGVCIGVIGYLGYSEYNKSTPEPSVSNQKPKPTSDCEEHSLLLHDLIIELNAINDKLNQINESTKIQNRYR